MGIVDDGNILMQDDFLHFVQPLLEEHFDGDEQQAQALCKRLYEALNLALGRSPISSLPKASEEFGKAINLGSVISAGNTSGWEDFSVDKPGMRGYVAQESLKSSTGKNASALKRRLLRK